MIKKTIIIITIFFSCVGFYAARFEAKSVTFDNAYVSGRIIKIKAPMSGVIASVNIDTGSHVSSQQIIYVYDDIVTQFALEKSKDAYKNTIRNEFKKCLKQRIDLGTSTLDSLDLALKKKKMDRTEKLKNSNLLAQSDYDNIAFQYDTSSAKQNISELKEAYFQYANQEPVLSRPNVKLSQAAFEEALYNQSMITVNAPTSGYVYESLVYPNQHVERGETLAVIISTEDIKIEANVLESEIEKIQPLMPVEIFLDIYPKRILHGWIHSIVPSTASSFSPVPRNNTDSNWIKVSQRIPVLIELEKSNTTILPIGSSAKIKIRFDTKKKNIGGDATLTSPKKAFNSNPTSKAGSDHEFKAESRAIVKSVTKHELTLAKKNVGEALCRL